MVQKKTIIILILIAVILFPLDPSILINRILGMPLHIILWVGFIAYILFIIPGDTLITKWRNLIKNIK